MFRHRIPLSVSGVPQRPRIGHGWEQVAGGLLLLTVALAQQSPLLVLRDPHRPALLWGKNCVGGKEKVARIPIQEEAAWAETPGEARAMSAHPEAV